MRKHLNDPVPSVKEYRKDVPEKLIQIIEKCMKKNKKDRYQRTRQILKEIDGIQDSKGKAIITSRTRLKVVDSADTILLHREKTPNTGKFKKIRLKEVEFSKKEKAP
jgi:hypothetical protein